MYKNGYMDKEKGVLLHNTLRMLWEQHVMWTRSFIISTASDLEDLPFVTNRLLENPSDFASVFRAFYGDAVAEEFQALLTEHLAIAGDLVNAAKQGDAQKANALRKNWYKNANEIALFLASINLYWSQETWQSLLYSHLEMTEEEAVSRLQGQYEENVKQYDAIEREALRMADYMYYGIAKQFLNALGKKID